MRSQTPLQTIDAILLIDPQIGFLSELGNRDALTRLFAHLTTLDIPFFVTVFINERGSSWDKHGYKQMFPGDPATELAISVSDEYVYPKHGYSALSNTSLLDALVRLEAKRVLLAGVETDACVLSTAMDLFEKQFDVVVAENGCATSAGAAIHAAALQMLKRNAFAEIITI